MRKMGWTALLILACGAAATAQSIDIQNCWGPSGTRIEHELPISWFQYCSDVYTSPAQSFRYVFRVLHNGTLKHSETFDVTNPPSPWHFTRDLNIGAWGLQVGDVITYSSIVRLLSNSNIRDADTLYGDCVDRVSSLRPRRGASSSFAAALDERRRSRVLIR